MPEALLRYNICNNVTKKNLINGFKENIIEIKKLEEEKKILFGKNFFQPLDLIKKNMNLKIKFFEINYIFELSKEILKLENKNINIYLDDYDFQILYDLLIIKNIFLEKNKEEDNDFLKKMKFMDEEEKKILFEKSYKNLLGEKNYKKYIKEKNKLKDVNSLFFDIPIEEYLEKSFFKINEYIETDNYQSKEVQDIIIKMAFLDVFFDNKIFNSDFICNEFFYITNKTIEKKYLNDLKKKFFIAMKIFENIKNNALENFEFKEFLSEEVINKEFEKISN